MSSELFPYITPQHMTSALDIIMSEWYLYLIRCRDGNLYTGIATDVPRRLAEHCSGNSAGSKYLRGRGPLTLVFQKKLGSKSLALRVERRVKKLSRAQKEKLIKDNEYIEKMIKPVEKQATGAATL